MLRQVVDHAQRILSRSEVSIWCAVKLRNQCNRIIGYSICRSPAPSENGEGWLLRTLADRAETIFDVGANQGDWTALALESVHPQARAILFEPGRTTAENLEHRFRGDARVEVVQSALSDSVGPAIFYESAVSSEGSSLWKPISEEDSNCSYEVPCSTVEEEVKRRQLDGIDLLKVDTEGNDFFVLRGAEALLRRQAVGVIQFEYGSHWIAAGATLLRAVRYLESFGYEVFLLEPQGLRRVDPSWCGEYFGYSNLVAIAPAFHDVFRLEHKAS